MKGRHLPPLRALHHVQLLQGGQELFPALIHAIDHSAREVRFETYIFHASPAGEQMLAALARAARRGVTVYLVIDGVGTPTLPIEWRHCLDEAGVHWRVFQPLGSLGLLIPSRWRRLHRKLCVVDGHVAFCGGINVLDDLDDPNHGPLQAPRLDYAVRVVGPLVRAVHDAMAQLWWRMQASSKIREVDLAGAWQQLQQGAQRVLREDDAAAEVSGRASVTGVRAALLLRDNVRNRSRIERAYRKAIAEARAEVIIANAYFAPGRKLRKALILARQRGVRVRLLLQGRYEYFMQVHAVRMIYGVLLNAGVEIHEYAPSFMHAKVAVIDGHWATVGSSNLEPLSLLLAREANVVVEDVEFAAILRTRLLREIELHGRRVDPTDYASRPWRQRALDRVAYYLMRVGVFLTGSRY